MKLKDAQTYKEYFSIIQNDMSDGRCCCLGFVTQNYALFTTKLGYMDEGHILVFYKESEGKKWVKEHTYKGQSSKYEIVRIWNSRETNYRWDIKSK